LEEEDAEFTGIGAIKSIGLMDLGAGGRFRGLVHGVGESVQRIGEIALVIFWFLRSVRTVIVIRIIIVGWSVSRRIIVTIRITWATRALRFGRWS
jgi:hypothetical protein